MTFGNRLKEERKRLGWTSDEVADIGGITRTSQSKYETDKTRPTVDYLAKVCEAGMDVEYLVLGKQKTGSNSVGAIPQEFLPEVFRMIDFYCQDEKGRSLSPDMKARIFKEIEKLSFERPDITSTLTDWRLAVLERFKAIQTTLFSTP